MSTAIVDASALVDALLPGSRGDLVRDVLSGLSTLAGPEHLGVSLITSDPGSRQPPRPGFDEVVAGRVVNEDCRETPDLGEGSGMSSLPGGAGLWRAGKASCWSPPRCPAGVT